MRSPLVFALVAVGCTVPLRAQLQIQRTIPLILYESPSTEAAVGRAVSQVLNRKIRTRFEYERFVQDLVNLGEPAVPFIVKARGVSDRFATEVVLRLGGEPAREWVAFVLNGGKETQRLALLRGVPAAQLVHKSVLVELRPYLHDTSPRVRSLAVRQLNRLVPAQEMLVRCRDMDRSVAREAIEVVSQNWLFLNHQGNELRNLKTFIGTLETHVRDVEWAVSRAFTLALEKDRIAESKDGRKLLARARKLPWLRTGFRGVRAEKLKALRAKLQAAPGSAQVEIAKTLRQLTPRAGAEVLLVLGSSPRVEERMAACDAGMKLLDPELASAFVSFLKDADHRVRDRAKELLKSTSFYADQRRRWGAPRRL